uniref:Uncharacterized protein n=1 Tax=Anguilla anguilla TaxID=7936 RepID=A0A0E9USQ0_ANGAN
MLCIFTVNIIHICKWELCDRTLSASPQSCFCKSALPHRVYGLCCVIVLFKSFNDSKLQ